MENFPKLISFAKPDTLPTSISVGWGWGEAQQKLSLCDDELASCYSESSNFSIHSSVSTDDDGAESQQSTLISSERRGKVAIKFPTCPRFFTASYFSLLQSGDEGGRAFSIVRDIKLNFVKLVRFSFLFFEDFVTFHLLCCLDLNDNCFKFARKTWEGSCWVQHLRFKLKISCKQGSKIANFHGNFSLK